MADGCQTITTRAFGPEPMAATLGLKPPPFARGKAPFRQLEYIQSYLKDLGCKTVIEEGHYIDRDHIEDHSAFYSRNFVSYNNFCRRLHFFSGTNQEATERLKTIVATGEKGRSEYRNACKDFSQQSYLGSVVIKPLDGCPVGRAILRPYPEKENGKPYIRVFPCVRPHRAHLLGVELTVNGLPFQQQDTGVSACATTAIWCALNHFKEIEEIASATPAQITSAASRYSLPFGRPMPSEGLSMEQMCQAIQSIGVSPHLHRVISFESARSLIYSATVSGMASILILRGNGGSHAVAVAGMKLASPFTHAYVTGAADLSAQMMGAYIHDDRWGPYVSTLLNKDGQGNPQLRLLRRGAVEQEENWMVTHILLPMHAKIRVSFAGLNQVAMEIVKQVHLFFRVELKQGIPDVLYSTLIMRGHKYVEELLFEQPPFGAEAVEEFTRKVSLPRYVGVVRLENALIGTIEILVDTTGTLRNLHCSAVICRVQNAPHAKEAGNFLAKHFGAFPEAFGISD